MNDTTVKNLRAVADHIEHYELTGLAHLNSVQRSDGLELQLWIPAEQKRIPVFLAWGDTLGGPAVESTAKSVSGRWHLIAVGVLLGGTPVKVTVVIDGDERDSLTSELYDACGTVPIHRDVLAKIADPELLDDRPAVTP